jgi:ankyrin repeat protein
MAATHGKLDAVRFLLRELGADVSLWHNGFTALIAAAQEGHEHVVRCLVQEFGANVNQPADNGFYFPLSVAAARGKSMWCAACSENVALTSTKLRNLARLCSSQLSRGTSMSCGAS